VLTLEAPKAACSIRCLDQELRHDRGRRPGHHLDPALRLLLFRKDRFHVRPRWLGGLVNGLLVGTIHSEEKHPSAAY